MRKLIMLAAVVALVAAVGVPAAFAQNFPNFNNNDNNNRFDDNNFNDNNHHRNNFNNGGGGGVSQEFDQQTDPTGDVNLSTQVSGSGSNSNQCVAPLQFGNTGNLQNSQGFLQYASQADDIQFEGSSFEFTPEQNVECNQAVQQSSAASSW